VCAALLGLVSPEVVCVFLVDFAGVWTGGMDLWGWVGDVGEKCWLLLRGVGLVCDDAAWQGCPG
jgi:hypothetical protein